MARIRSIKPEFWTSEQVAECSTNARLAFVGLWNFCDDRGVHPARPKTVKAELFPMDDITAADVAGWIGELIRVGLVREFRAADGIDYWHVTGWDKHQRIDRPSYKHPAPPADTCAGRPLEFDDGSASDSTSVRPRLDECSAIALRAPPPGVEGSGEDRSGGEVGSPKARTRPRSKKTAIPPDLGISNRVQAWAAQKGFDRLDEHLEAFKSKAAAKAYTYADWDEAFMGAIRDDWAGLRTSGAYRNGGARQPALACEEQIR